MSKIQKATTWIKKQLGLQGLLYQYKKEALSTIAAITLIISGAGVGHSYYQDHLQSIYHVYLNGEKVGTVDHPDLINEWIEQKTDQLADQYEHVHLHTNQRVQFEEEIVYKPTYDNQEALRELKEQYMLSAEAIRLTIDGTLIGYIPNQELLSQLLDEVKQEYVSKEFLAALDSQNKNQTVSIASFDASFDDLDRPLQQSNQRDDQLELATQLDVDPASIELDQPVMIEAAIEQEVETEEVMISPNQVLDEEQLREKLFEPIEKEKVYKVKKGDVFGSIAKKHGLTTKELAALNPGWDVNEFLQIGQELKVTSEESYLTVKTVELLKEEEEIPFEVETKDAPDLFRGESKVSQEGKNGKKIVEYKLVKKNGTIESEETIGEEIVSEPVNKVVLKGTKVKPSRGTGSLQWPAVGGKVTSGYGMRWGRMHAGIDIAGVSNRSILAADHGTVVAAGWHSGGYGNYVIINHGNGYRTKYAHLSSIGVKTGQVVQKGERIGVMGSTGQSTGVHLHFEVIRNGSTVNPLSYLRR